MPNLADVVRARATIAGRIHPTPLVESPALGARR
jgi:threonine dehydratase